MEIFTLVSLIIPIAIGGISSGLIAGLFGVGGGIILVPSIVFTLEFLNYNQNITMHIAVATSLALIIPTAISSTWGHYKKNVVDLKIINRFFLPVIIGSVFGAFSAQQVSGDKISALGEDHPDVATTHNNTGNVYYPQGQYDKAWEM